MQFSPYIFYAIFYTMPCRYSSHFLSWSMSENREFLNQKSRCRQPLTGRDESKFRTVKKTAIALLSFLEKVFLMGYSKKLYNVLGGGYK